MGQKVSPHGFRVGINKRWNSEWYPSNKKDFATWLGQDAKIRNFLEKNKRKWTITKIIIERKTKEIIVHIHTSQPKVVLGNEGKNIKSIEKQLKRLINKDQKLTVNVIGLKNSDISAEVLAQEIAIALENRSSFRMVQKFAIRKALKGGAKGIKTSIAGRLNGVDMARTEGYSEGTIPLHTIRTDVDYCQTTALTKYGILGVKVWVNHGEIYSGFVNKNPPKPMQFNNRRTGNFNKRVESKKDIEKKLTNTSKKSNSNEKSN